MINVESEDVTPGQIAYRAWCREMCRGRFTRWSVLPALLKENWECIAEAVLRAEPDGDR